MPLLWLSLAFLGGLLLGAALPPLWPVSLAAAVGLLVEGYFEHRKFDRFSWYRPWRELSHLPLAVVLAAICLGIVRYQAAQGPLTENGLAWYNGRGEFRLEGVIRQPPEVINSNIHVLVSVEQLVPLTNGQPQGVPQPVKGLALAYLPLGQNWRYGDRIQLTGNLEEPTIEGAPFYHDSLARQGIYSSLGFAAARLIKHNQGSWFLSAVYDFRALADRTVARLLPQPESALLAGILLGDDSALPKNVADAFRATGITHIIAVSGFNVAIVSGLFVKLLGRILRARFAIPLAMLAVTGYTLLTGASPSVERAAVMGGIGMIGPLLGRQQAGANSLVFTAAVMCLFNPALPGDLSFQLSFGATLGLVLFADPLQGIFIRVAERWLSPPVARRISGPVGEFFLFTLAAQIFTLPITALNFQQVSFAALLANPLVLPVQPYAMVLGGAAAAGHGISTPRPVGGLVVLAPVDLHHSRRRVAGAVPKQRLERGHLERTAGHHLFCRAGCFPGRHTCAACSHRPGRANPQPAAVCLQTGAHSRFDRPADSGPVAGRFFSPDGRLHLDVLNLSGGPALLVRSPAGQAWLINGGEETNSLADALGRRLPLFTTRLDGMVVTADRSAAVINALDALTQKYTPAACALIGVLDSTKTLQRIWDHLQTQGVTCVYLDDVPSFDLGGGAALQVLADSKNGTALWLAAGGFPALIPGGVPPGEFDEPSSVVLSLLVLSSDDLKNMGPSIWAATFQPQAVLFAGGSPPLPEWINLGSYNWISFQSDGSQYWVEGAKK